MKTSWILLLRNWLDSDAVSHCSSLDHTHLRLYTNSLSFNISHIHTHLWPECLHFSCFTCVMINSVCVCLFTSVDLSVCRVWSSAQSLLWYYYGMVQSLLYCIKVYLDILSLLYFALKAWMIIELVTVYTNAIPRLSTRGSSSNTEHHKHLNPK